MSNPLSRTIEQVESEVIEWEMIVESGYNGWLNDRDFLNELKAELEELKEANRD